MTHSSYPKAKLTDSIRWKIENEIQYSLCSETEDVDEITCKRYWITALNNKRYLVWQFSDGLMAVVPEGGLLSQYMIHFSPTTARNENEL